MQSSGEMRRENVTSHSTVIVREGGRSSIPETPMIEPTSRSVPDAPPSRGMTTSFIPDYSGAAPTGGPPGGRCRKVIVA